MNEVKSNTRDIHSPANVQPEEYDYAGSFYQGPYSRVTLEAAGYNPNDPTAWDRFCNTELIRKVKASGYAGNFSDRSACDHCGTHFLYGVAYTHKPTGDLIAVGCDCMEKTFRIDDRATLDQNRLRSALQAARAREAVNRKSREYREGNPEVANAIDTINRDGMTGYEAETIRDIGNKLAAYGSLSEKQGQFVLGLFEKIRSGDTQAERTAEREERIARENAERAEALQTVAGWERGRFHIEGTILSVREADPYADYPADKMLVELTDKRRCWGSIPAKVWRTLGDDQELNDLRGARVSFTATFSPSLDDKHFAFYTRPAKVTSPE
jgi:hypothetical protein